MGRLLLPLLSSLISLALIIIVLTPVAMIVAAFMDRGSAKPSGKVPGYNYDKTHENYWREY